MKDKLTLRISTVTEAQNHPILGLLCLPLFSSVLNKSTLWSLLFMEEHFFCFDEDVHPFTSLFIISTQLIRCSIKSHIETVTKKMKGSSSE